MPQSPDLSLGPPSFSSSKWRTEAVTDIVFSKNWRTLAKASVALIIPSSPRLPVGLPVPVNIVVSIRSRSFAAQPSEVPVLPDVDEAGMKLGLFSTLVSYQSAKYQFSREPSALVLDLWGEDSSIGRRTWRNEAVWQQLNPKQIKDKTGFFEKIIVWSLAFEPDLLASYDGIHGRLSVRSSQLCRCTALKIDSPVRTQIKRALQQAFTKGQGVYALRIR